MKYYDLSDDVHVPDRWHLGRVIDLNEPNSSRLEFWLGKRLRDGMSPCANITQPGISLEFFLTSFAIPVSESNLAAVIAEKAGGDLERLPLELRGYEGYPELHKPTISLGRAKLLEI